MRLTIFSRRQIPPTPACALFWFLVFCTFFAAFLSVCCPGARPAQAAAGLETYSPAKEAGQPAQIIWKLTGLGRLAADLLVGPNGRLHLTAGNKLVAVDGNGKQVWEAPGPAGGQPGQPVFAGNGSIFLPGRAVIQEIKLNGAAGWSFAVYADGRGSGGAKAPLLAGGPGYLLYLPLPTGLYAVDVRGHYRWSLLQWDTGDLYATRPAQDREILACTGNSRTVFVVYGKRGDGYRLAAVDEKGNILWRYWLGDLKQCHLVMGKDERLIVVANPAKVDRFNKGKIYAFRGATGGDGDLDGSGSRNRNGGENADWNEHGRPLWTFSLPYDDLSAPAPAADGTLYFCAAKKVFALATDNGLLKWELPLLNVVSPPAVDGAGGRIYAGSSDGRLFAVSPAGRMIWERELDGAIDRAPLSGPDGYLYVATNKGTLYKIKDNSRTEE
ncbi:MAG: PQQ-binding-like beta-propeller repeat protein [Bacillota bacterium]